MGADILICKQREHLEVTETSELDVIAAVKSAFYSPSLSPLASNSLSSHVPVVDATNVDLGGNDLIPCE